MAVRILSLVSLLVACNGSKDDTSPSTDTDTEPETLPTTSDSGTPRPQRGSIEVEVIRASATPWNPASSTFAALTYLEDDGDCINPLDFFFYGYCFTDLGAVGNQPTLSYGPRQIFLDGGAGSVGDVEIPDDPNYGVDLAFDFEWPSAPGAIATEGGSDIPAYDGGLEASFPVMEVTSPSATDFVVMEPAAALEVTWTPGGAGEVLITVFAPGGSSFLRTEDDGSATIPANTFGFSGVLDGATVLVTRIEHGEEEIDEFTRVSWYGKDEVQLTLEFRNLGAIPTLDGTLSAEDCSTVGAIPPLTTGGQWYVDTHLATNELELDWYNGLTYFPTPGGEVLVPIALLPGQTLDATWRSVFGDASLYLLDAACDLDAGLTGSDGSYANEEEQITYTSAAGETVYLVLDAYDVGSPGLLEIEIQ